MTRDKLKNLIKKLPQRPGIYIFEDSQNKNLYIGKASSLRSRVGHYLKAEDTRLAKLVDLSKKLKIQVTDSDIEALILESQLIKKYRPKFNIVMRDDKQYFYVAFTDEMFSRVFITHQPRTGHKQYVAGYRQGGKKLKTYNLEPITYFVGPFMDGSALKLTLRYLRSVFPFCTCKQKHVNFCLNYHIGKCIGYCCLKNPTPAKEYEKDYSRNIKALKDILNGKKEGLVKRMRMEMKSLAARQKFKEAKILRDKMESVQRVFENARIIKKIEFGESPEIISDLKRDLKLKSRPDRIEGYDISNIQGVHAAGSMVVFTNGRADKNEYRKFKIRQIKNPDDIGMLKEVLTRRLSHFEWQLPDLILVDGGKGQLNAVKSILRRAGKNIFVASLTKDERHSGHHIFLSNKKLPVSLRRLSVNGRNLILKIGDEAHRFAQSYYQKLHARFLHNN